MTYQSIIIVIHDFRLIFLHLFYVQTLYKKVFLWATLCLRLPLENVFQKLFFFISVVYFYFVVSLWLRLPTIYTICKQLINTAEFNLPVIPLNNKIIFL